MRATRRLLSFLRPYWIAALLAPLTMALEVAMDLAQPRLIQRIIDEGIARGDMQVVTSTGLLMVGAALIGLAGGVGSTVFTMIAALGFAADLRAALFRKVQSLSFGNLDRLETGGLITRLTSDVSQVQELVMMLLRIMVRVPLLLIGSLIMAIITDPQLALIFLVLMPLVGGLLVWVIRKTFPMFGAVQQRLDSLNTVLQENLAGIRVVRAFARGDHELQRFGRANDSLMQQTIMAVQTGVVTMPAMMLLMNIGVVAVIWLGGIAVQAGDIQVGQLVAFINYLTQTLMSLMMIGMLVMRFARAEASSQRIGEVLAEQPDLAPPAAGAAQPLRGQIAFEHVSFSYYRDGRDPVLKDLSFTAAPGETVALLGATGAGKSSLVNLIPRFYDVSAGRIMIDGVDVRAMDETHLHQQVGVVLQESILFSGTVRDNIRYGRPDASDAEVEAAARMAQAHDFISRLPEGYSSIVGQRGVNLSGGQKQRIAIARALLVQPSILVLDDSTSAVDLTTEAQIQAALSALPQRPTRVLVAQRISSVVGADTILVIDDGQIVAEGSHATLMAQSPIYREIYNSQIDQSVIAHD